MKKLIAFAVAAAAAVSVATAQIDLTVGARGIFGIGAGMFLGDPGTDTDLGKSLDFGGAAFAKVPVYKGLVIQPEVGFTYNMVGEKDDNGGKKSGAYMAIDIPVLIGYDLKVSNELTVTPLFGPKFSIPVGKFSSVKGNGKSAPDMDIENVILFSIVTGVSASYKVGPGAIVGDIRYVNGVSGLATKAKGDSSKNASVQATPRNLQFSVGYQMTLPL